MGAKNRGASVIDRRESRRLPRHGDAAEHEVHRAAHAERCPEKIDSNRLLHVDQAEGHEYAERNYFLDHLQLRQRLFAEANVVGGNLEQVLEESDSPA